MQNCSRVIPVVSNLQFSDPNGYSRHLRDINFSSSSTVLYHIALQYMQWLTVSKM